MLAAALGIGLCGCATAALRDDAPGTHRSGERSTAAVATPAGARSPEATPAAADTGTPHPEETVKAVSAIYSVSATPPVVHGGQSVHWDVRTTPDVVSVAAHVAAITLPLRRVSPGHFLLTFAVPSGVPFFFHGVYDLDVRADTAAGSTLHRGIVLTFQ